MKNEFTLMKVYRETLEKAKAQANRKGMKLQEYIKSVINEKNKGIKSDD